MMYREPEMQATETQIHVVGWFFTALMAVFATGILVAIPLRVGLNLLVKERRKTHLKETVWLSLITILLFAYLWESHREFQALAPPINVTTIDEFSKSMPPPQHLRLIDAIDVSGKQLIAWSGDLAGPLSLPSGRACYLFDNRGQLIDWQPETGDGGPVDDVIRTSKVVRTLTLAEALQMTQEGA